MKKTKLALVVVGLLLAVSTSASATLLGSYNHDYGNGAGEVDPSGTDQLFSDYVLVSDQSSNRFSDTFDFSSLAFSSIDKFGLTLSFANTNASLFGVPLEFWWTRPGGEPGTVSSDWLLTRVGSTPTSQLFEIGNSLSSFANMVSSKEFFFWFAEEAPFSNSFKLYSANLDIYGTPESAPVPEPGTILLLGSGLAGLLARKRMKKNS